MYSSNFIMQLEVILSLAMVILVILTIARANVCNDPSLTRFEYINKQCCSLSSCGVVHNPYNTKNITKELNLIIPAYFYPTNNGVIVQDWKTLNESAHTFKDVRHVIVINPANGEDATSPPNSDWVPIIDMFKDLDNVVLIGYVSTNYGDATKEAPGIEQISGYIAQWSCQGIFFDETTGDRSMYERLIAHTENQMQNTFNVFNFGSKADASGNEYDNAWLTLATLNIMFENRYPEVASYSPSAAQLALDRSKSAVVLLQADLNTINIRTMYEKHFGYVYFVDRPDDYNGLYSKSDWMSFMQSVDVFTVEGQTAGSSCSSDSVCGSNDCRTKCCVSTLNDANCAVCSASGFCESCATGYSWVSGQGCVANQGASAGTACAANGDCLDQDCRTRCCVSTLNDANCGVCSTTGFCESCASGYTWVAGQGCTLSSGATAGAACSSNSDCADDDCRTRCCSSFLNDANCGVCGTTGFCESCASGYSWVAGQGCV